MKAALILAALALPAAAESYVPVVTPNGSTLPYKLDRGVKVFHLVAEQVKREIAPGMVINAWGYKDRKSTRLNSSHGYISYAVFCLKKKKTTIYKAQSSFNIALA